MLRIYRNFEKASLTESWPRSKLRSRRITLKTSALRISETNIILTTRTWDRSFSDKIGSRLWIDGFKASQAFLGLLLLPVLVLLMLYPAHGKLLIGAAVLLYLVGRLIFIYKGFRIFYSNLTSIVYFILYLCAVEIVPLAIMAGVTHWISGIL